MSETTSERRFRRATMDDLPVMLKIYQHARELMAANGNPTQWGNTFPREEVILDDIRQQRTMLLVDEVELIDGVAHGKCHIKGDEYFLQGHFPGNPVVPGVIQCEMLAQSACVLLASGASEGCTPLFTSLDKVKFRGQVKPGDTLETECEITRQRGQFYFAKGKGMVGGKLCVSAEFSFALVKSE